MELSLKDLFLFDFAGGSLKDHMKITREVPTHNSGVSLKTWKIPCRHFHFPGAHLEVLKKITNSFPRWFHDFVLLPTSMRASAASHFHQW